MQYHIKLYHTNLTTHKFTIYVIIDKNKLPQKTSKQKFNLMYVFDLTFCLSQFLVPWPNPPKKLYYAGFEQM